MGFVKSKRGSFNGYRIRVARRPGSTERSGGMLELLVGKMLLFEWRGFVQWLQHPDLVPRSCYRIRVARRPGSTERSGGMLELLVGKSFCSSDVVSFNGYSIPISFLDRATASGWRADRVASLR